MSNMHDLTGWTPATCVESDGIRQGLRPVSSLTDPEGIYSGSPVIYTEWAGADEEPVLRDYRWPGTDRTCEHYVPSRFQPATQGEGGE